MRFEVPQFIEVEDKIFGPFTWKQFVYLAGGAGATVILYILLPFVFFILIAGPVVALSIGLACMPVNNRPLSIFLESVVKYIASSRLYLWKKDETRRAIEQATEAPSVYAPPTKNTIHSLSRTLELNALQKNIPDDE